MAAVFTVALLFGAGLYIAVEDWIRLKNPTTIQGNLVIWAALLGILANGISTRMLHAGAKENLNMLGAFLPMLTDTLTSLGVALLGVIWLFRPWYWLYPNVSWAIVALILYGGWGILKDALLLSKFNLDHPILQFETKAYASKDLLCNLCQNNSNRAEGTTWC